MKNMNSKENYTIYYTKIYSKIENEIKKYLLIQCEKNRSFGISLNEILSFLIQNIPVRININSNNQLKELHNLFVNRHSYYKKEVLKNILENEIERGFSKIEAERLPQNYNFDKLIFEFAFTDATNEICRLLTVNNKLFELFYELNEFDQFEIKHYADSSLENTEPYKSLYNKRHPQPQMIDEYDENDTPAILNAKLDSVQKTLLIEKLIKNAHQWETFSERKKAEIISFIIERNAVNIRKTLSMSDKKPSEYSAKFIKDNLIANKIIDPLA
ncbi:MAG: hypothetical protein CFE24_11075 [Flavobacterium sp. BFFFF2]|nr:MAG: hypothetical protein CFE24_11075 [Flavobacterium sp. BFFFF2]